MIENSGPLGKEFLDSIGDLEPFDGSEALLQDIGSTVKADVSEPEDIRKILKLVAQIEKLEREGGVNKWFESPYSIHSLPKHKKFFDASAEYNEVLFMAGNRTGKSVAGAYALACHLTGVYPSWWNGRVFDHPIEAWAVGKDARATRDTLQKELLGGIGEWGTGMLPAHTLGKAYALQGVPQGIDIIKIKHIPTGGWSELGFKNYQQDVGSFMGTTRHVVLGDEEMPQEIYNEANIRTATVDGLMLLTFTPLDGLTPLVVNFCKNADFLTSEKPIVAIDQEDAAEDWDGEGEQLVGKDRSKCVITAGWDDVPWLTPHVKARLLEDTPEYLREARSKGLPAMGAGNVYSTQIDQIMIDPFVIPDSWPRMYGLDVGWNRTAAVWAALDPNTDTLYIYDEHYLGKAEPSIHAHAIQGRGDWVHGAIDPAARGRGQTDGQQLIRMYKDLGLILYPAKNDVESGISAIGQRLASNRLKVFKTCINLMKEYMLYRRDKNGRVIKENDHALDALRYIINNMNRMISKAESKSMTGVKYSAKRYDI